MEGKLEKATKILAVLFFVLALALNLSWGTLIFGQITLLVIRVLFLVMILFDWEVTSMDEILYNIRKEMLTNMFNDENYRPMKLKELCVLLNVPKDEREDLKLILDRMVSEGLNYNRKPRLL